MLVCGSVRAEPTVEPEPREWRQRKSRLVDRGPVYRDVSIVNREWLDIPRLTPNMNPFLAYFVVSFVAALLWTLILLRANPLDRRSVGLPSAWAATLVLASLWQAAAVPWLGNFLQLLLLVWLIAITFLVIVVATTWSPKPPWRLLLFFCALISMVVNVAAGLHFLWIATVSPAGV